MLKMVVEMLDIFQPFADLIVMVKFLKTHGTSFDISRKVVKMVTIASLLLHLLLFLITWNHLLISILSPMFHPGRHQNNLQSLTFHQKTGVRRVKEAIVATPIAIEVY